MYLRASEKDSKGDRDGYVLTLKHGRVKSGKLIPMRFHQIYEQPVILIFLYDDRVSWLYDGFRGYCMYAIYFGRNIV
jgi:nicotinamide riboside kinase